MLSGKLQSLDAESTMCIFRPIGCCKLPKKLNVECLAVLEQTKYSQ
jgi:hypothetical protein